MEVIGAPTLDDALNELSVRIERAEARGEKNFIFCEDRLTLLAERAVLRATGGATFSSEVSTFARFLSGDRQVLSKEGSVVALSSIMQEKKELLTCFNGAQAQAVYETIAQLLSSRVDGALLRESAAETEGTLKRKLCDLALLLDEYGAFLHEKGLVDENGYLALLPEKIASGVFSDTNVYFFAFPSFTAQAREGVRAALLNAKSVTGIFLAGREAFYTNEGARVFKETLQEVGEPQVTFLKNSLTGEQLVLSKALFSPESMGNSNRQSEKITFLIADDEGEEADGVCALIKKHIREGMRYRDVAVLTDGNGFDVWEKYFRRYRIPYFADRKRPFSDHPFCKFLFSVLEGAADGVLPETADAIASGIYFGDGDEYRNYLLKYGCGRGAYKREIREGEAVQHYRREALVSCREKLISVMKLFPKRAKGREYVVAVRELRALVGEEKITEKLSESFAGAERSFLKLTPLENILEEILLVAGERRFTAREFLTLLESGTKAVAVSMIPQSPDAVFLGDITESKLRRVKVLFCTALTDALPRVTTDTAVINDGEITKLKALRVEVEPAIAVVNSRAREALALNLLSFEDKLYLSYPVKRGGEEQNPSEVLDYCKSAFLVPTMHGVFPFNCCEKESAALALCFVKDDFEAGRDEDGRKYASLYAAIEEGGDMNAFCDRESVAEAAGTLWFSGDISPTLLERYFSCPYQCFAENALRLRARDEGVVPDTDTGNFVHDVLKEIALQLNGFQNEAECRAVTRAVAEEMLSSPKYAQFADTGEGRYAGVRLVEESVEAAAATYKQLTGSSFRVSAREEVLSLPALSVKGRADRIDEAEGFYRVIDYKTGAAEAKPVAYYTGRKLQLQLYLLAAAGAGTAAGAFYFPAQDAFTKEGEEKYRMQGYFSAEEKVLKLMDTERAEGAKSAFFEGGGRSEKGMTQEDFNDFLGYSVLVADKAEREMKAGNITPSPYAGVCAYCALKGMCAFTGVARNESAPTCKEIVKIVRRERREEE